MASTNVVEIFKGDAATAVQRRTDAVNLWEADRQRWKIQHPATAWLAEGMPIEQTFEVATAISDGSRLLVNPTWNAGLDEATRRFVQAHLLWHVAAGHLRRPPTPGTDLHRWHLACDHEANAVLLMLGMSLPAQAVLFPACIGKPLPDVYAWLGDSPLLASERSMDGPPWLAALHEVTHTRIWRERVHALIKQFLGTPHLPVPVVAWLLGCW
ncbi:Putative metallopeptidase domain-containing protein [Modicisalibacter xianhensis]|uniref:Putative metallopeptidase domain-containing protein n=2 Tax=Modicisalibacter xianhensis TaxID=442341 RepID=A0A1I2ZJJ7_9GAMM|nr:Putative metallopeptidase domain-containing protein [Halomonas xianhensis]